MVLAIAILIASPKIKGVNPNLKVVAHEAWIEWCSQNRPDVKIITSPINMVGRTVAIFWSHLRPAR